MKMKLAVWYVACLLLMAGCGPRPRDSSRLTITPGVGIPGVAEILKTPDEIAKACDLNVEEYKNIGGYGFCVLSLGAHWEQETRTGRVPNIYFAFDSGILATIHPPKKIQAFRGSINGRLDCGKKGGLTRSDVVSVFGSPTETVDWGRPTNPERVKDFRSKFLAGRSISTPMAYGTEVLYYPTNGIIFTLWSNVLVSINITPKVEPTNAPYSSPAPQVQKR